MTTEVSLPHGFVALVDDEDAEAVLARKWYSFAVHRQRYVASTSLGTRLYLHRFLLDAPKGVMVDHINRDGLDNRRSNLRLCTDGLNKANSASRLGSTSRYKGVWWSTRERKWKAQIQVNRVSTSLGTFTDEAEAARAYDVAALAAWGEFARLNFPGS